MADRPDTTGYICLLCGAHHPHGEHCTCDDGPIGTPIVRQVQPTSLTAWLTAWLDENSYVIAAAVVAAYELAPSGSGIDGALGLAGDALMAMVRGERDPLAAVAAENASARRQARHWLVRWQDSTARLEATEHVK